MTVSANDYGAEFVPAATACEKCGTLIFSAPSAHWPPTQMTLEAEGIENLQGGIWELCPGGEVEFTFSAFGYAPHGAERCAVLAAERNKPVRSMAEMLAEEEAATLAWFKRESQHTRPCKKCGASIFFGERSAGKYVPLDPHLVRGKFVWHTPTGHKIGQSSRPGILGVLSHRCQPVETVKYKGGRGGSLPPAARRRRPSL